MNLKVSCVTRLHAVERLTGWLMDKGASVGLMDLDVAISEYLKA